MTNLWIIYVEETNVKSNSIQYSERKKRIFYCETFFTFLRAIIKGRSLDFKCHPSQLELADFWMTNSITRASPTMAECVRAAKSYKEHPHLDVPKKYCASA